MHELFRTLKSTLPKLYKFSEGGGKFNRLITDLPSFTPLEKLTKERKKYF